MEDVGPSDESSDTCRGCAAVLWIGDGRPGPACGAESRAALPQAWWLRHDDDPYRSTVGCAEWLAATRVAHHRGRAEIRGGWVRGRGSDRHRGHGARALARAQPAHVQSDWPHDREVRR